MKKLLLATTVASAALLVSTASLADGTYTTTLSNPSALTTKLDNFKSGLQSLSHEHGGLPAQIVSSTMGFSCTMKSAGGMTLKTTPTATVMTAAGGTGSSASNPGLTVKVSGISDMATVAGGTLRFQCNSNTNLVGQVIQDPNIYIGYASAGNGFQLEVKFIEGSVGKKVTMHATATDVSSSFGEFNSCYVNKVTNENTCYTAPSYVKDIAVARR